MSRLHTSLMVAVLAAGLSFGCGEGEDPGPDMSTLRTGAPLSFSPVYDAVEFTGIRGANRMWYPMDVTPGPDGALWVVQRAERLGGLSDDEECTNLGLQGLRPDDCGSLPGSTVAITDPGMPDMATSSNGRADLVNDANAWHFLRRPSGIAFGVDSWTINPGDPGTEDPNGGSAIASPVTYTDLFATCHEHWTGNLTDQNPFIGPSLWSADPDFYDDDAGTILGTFAWSNGDHIDMLHGTRYCMGIAHERDNVFWLFNGFLGTLDVYDFAAPHLPGHFNHDDGAVTRYLWPSEAELSRQPDVPSNMVIDGNTLIMTDTGNGRVISMDISEDTGVRSRWTTFEGIEGDVMNGLTQTELASFGAIRDATLDANPQPSGLAIVDDETVLAADYTTGNLLVIDRNGGGVVRTIDTGTGMGIGGLTVIDGEIYFAQIEERRIYRASIMPMTDM